MMGFFNERRLYALLTRIINEGQNANFVGKRPWGMTGVKLCEKSSRYLGSAVHRLPLALGSSGNS